MKNGSGKMRLLMNPNLMLSGISYREAVERAGLPYLAPAPERPSFVFATLPGRGGKSALYNRISPDRLREIDGMGFLDTVTIMDRTKTTCQVSAGIISPKWFDAVPCNSTCRWNHLKGYEIHMGNTTGDVGLFKINRLNRL